MAHTAENVGGTKWIVKEIDDSNGVMIGKKTIFCRTDENSAEDAVKIYKAPPAGDIAPEGQE